MKNRFKKTLILVVTFCLGFSLALFSMYFINNHANSWKKKFQVSEIRIEDNYYVFDVNNLTNDIYYIDIWFSATNGDVTLNDACMFQKIEGNELKKMRCPMSNKIDTTYKVKLKKIVIND